MDAAIEIILKVGNQLCNAPLSRSRCTYNPRVPLTINVLLHIFNQSLKIFRTYATNCDPQKSDLRWIPRQLGMPSNMDKLGTSDGFPEMVTSVMV